MKYFIIACAFVFAYYVIALFYLGTGAIVPNEEVVTTADATPKKDSKGTNAAPERSEDPDQGHSNPGYQRLPQSFLARYNVNLPKLIPSVNHEKNIFCKKVSTVYIIIPHSNTKIAKFVGLKTPYGDCLLIDSVINLYEKKRNELGRSKYNKKIDGCDTSELLRKRFRKFYLKEDLSILHNRVKLHCHMALLLTHFGLGENKGFIYDSRLRNEISLYLDALRAFEVKFVIIDVPFDVYDKI